MRGALWGLKTEAKFALLEKKVVDHELVETNVIVARFTANLQPAPPEALRILPEGERKWRHWAMLTTQDLPNDSVVVDAAGRQFRVVSLTDWRAAGFEGYLLSEQPPQSLPAAAYATGPREPIKVVADIQQFQLSLADDAVVLAYEKNLIPKSTGLYVSLDYVGPAKCLANVNEVDPETGAEIQSATYSHLVQIDLLSYDASARRRKEEAAMALASVYAVQQMELYGISIARNPSPFLDASSAEPTKRLNRFVSTAQLFAVHRKVLPPPDLYETFPGGITEGGPLKPFAPANVFRR
jgi:hypothetical protein